jgi:hypothetical protein
MVAGAAIVFQSHLWRAVAPVVPLFDMMEPLPITPETAWFRAILYEDRLFTGGSSLRAAGGEFQRSPGTSARLAKHGT